MFSKGNLVRILESLRDGGLVQEFLTRRPELLHCHLFQWVAKFRQVALLQFLFALAKDQGEGVVAYQKGVYPVIKTASRYGHLGILK